MPRRNYASQQEAADRYGLTTRTIRNKISEGVITGYKLPGTRAIRVDLDEIEKLITVIPAATKPEKSQRTPTSKKRSAKPQDAGGSNEP